MGSIEKMKLPRTRDSLLLHNVEKSYWVGKNLPVPKTISSRSPLASILFIIPQRHAIPTIQPLVLHALADASYSSFMMRWNRLFRPSFFLFLGPSSSSFLVLPLPPAATNTSRARLFRSLRRMASSLHLGLSRYCRQSQTMRLSCRYRKAGSPGKAPGVTVILRCLAARTLTALVPARISSCRLFSSRRARCPSHPSMSVQHLMQASWEQAAHTHIYEGR